MRFTLYVKAPGRDRDGRHVVTYWSADLAGNVEQVHTAEVDVDGSGPLLRNLVPGDGATVSGLTPVHFSVDAANLAGVGDVTFVVQAPPGGFTTQSCPDLSPCSFQASQTNGGGAWTSDAPLARTTLPAGAHARLL